LSLAVGRTEHHRLIGHGAFTVGIIRAEDALQKRVLICSDIRTILA
jgi:hypothetical protein